MNKRERERERDVRKSCCCWLVSNSNNKTCIIMTKAKSRGRRRRRDWTPESQLYFRCDKTVDSQKSLLCNHEKRMRRRQWFHQSVCNLIFILLFPSLFLSIIIRSPSEQPVFVDCNCWLTKREGGFSNSPQLFSHSTFYFSRQFMSCHEWLHQTTRLQSKTVTKRNQMKKQTFLVCFVRSDLRRL